LGDEAVERAPEALLLPLRFAQEGEVAPHLAIAAVDRLVQLFELARHAAGIALQEELARLDAEVDARERLDEAVVQIARDPTALLGDCELLGLLLQPDVLEA